MHLRAWDRMYAGVEVFLFKSLLTRAGDIWDAPRRDAVYNDADAFAIRVTIVRDMSYT